MRDALVIHGPSVWFEKMGEVVAEDEGFVVVRIHSRDDGGDGVYDVRMPRECVEIEEASARA